jgi:hypothetical protein
MMRIRDWLADALGVVMLFGILYGVLFLGAVFG